jgi:polyisoprenoid-binding protein YceI
MKLLPGILVLIPVLASADTLKVDKAKSRIQVDVKATGHEFTGTLSDFSAKVTGDDPALTPTAVDLTWKFSDLKTADEKRDKEMIKWLGGGGPEGSFTFTKTWTDKGKTYAMGDLKIHGISKAVSFPYTAKKEGTWVTIDGTASLDYQDFGLPIIRTMAVMTVNPKLAVRFHLVGEAK